MDYSFSLIRKVRRAELTQQLRAFYLSRLLSAGMPPDVVNVPCMVCGRSGHPDTMHLHEIVRRGLFSNKMLLEALPVELHALVCPECNQTKADQAKWHRRLVRRSCLIWGQEQVKTAVTGFNAEWNRMAGHSMPRAIFNYDALDEDETEWATKFSTQVRLQLF
jgi:hypothetical protein